MLRRTFTKALVAGAALCAAGAAFAEEPLKVGLIFPMTGPFASTGRQLEAGAKLWVAQHGDKVAGRKIELIIRDDTGVADITQRLAQERITNDKVAVIGGFGLTPTAFAVAPLITQAKIPAITMAAATASITAQSPFMTRTSYSTSQVSSPIAEWAIKNGFKTAVTMVSDYGPGVDSETAFSTKFKELGGTIKANLRVPVVNPDFSAYLQRVSDEKPDMLFTFVPSGVGVALMNQFVERGLDKAGVKIVAEGGIVDDDILSKMSDAVIGIVTGYHYSAAHESAENKAFQADFSKANPELRGNNMALGAYDGMALIYKALEKTGGKSDGQTLMDAMKGMSWTSPRGPISIDPETHDIVQNVYMRETKKVNGQLYNVEFATIPAAKAR